MITFPVIPEDEMVRRLAHPGRKIRMVLDTDTYNEIDDQFAVAYALASGDKMEVEAFYAAPFFNELSTGQADGMEKSYQELLKILRIMRREDIPVFRGSTSYMSGLDVPVDSEAAHDLIARAMASDPNDPLYVVAIGAITNVASALAMEPRIAERIVVVWLGGNALHWPDTREFNLQQDLHASRLVLDCGVPLVLVPCLGVATHLQTSLSELRDYVKGQGELGDYLYETYERCTDDHFAYSRVIWDIAVIAWINNPEWCWSGIVHSPHLSEDMRWSMNVHRHFIRCVHYIRRDEVFRDLFRKIAAYTAG
ncbi:nucleoside hydrolase [Paenibacillus sp. D2_2]|uniref:nucleoside hydrolase n=1 Tax=Paenibacillus sp. D2_2 TaxID=3073092 RepID=UPI0028162114|nr:nucleoside hydrolase [Paenibacillus sp. D2_2]WMT39445.1 nucleoside hydrolase [Paenibacillus sp. D2_2]